MVDVVGDGSLKACRNPLNDLPRKITNKEKEFFTHLPTDDPAIFSEILAELYQYTPEFDDWTISELIELFEKKKIQALRGGTRRK